MAASSGLRENVYPINFFMKKVHLYNIIIVLIGIDDKKPMADVIFSDTDVNTCLDVVSLFTLFK